MRSFALICFLFSVAASGAFADTAFHFFSEPGDLIGQGKEKTVTPADGYSFVVQDTFGTLSFEISHSSPDKSYKVTFGPPFPYKLAPGEYSNAIVVQQALTVPQLSFNANGRIPRQGNGHFEVLEITYDSNGTLATFAANFTQREGGALAASSGQIRYNSSIPYLTPAGVANLSAGKYSVCQDAGVLSVTVDRRDGSAGALSVDFSTAAGTAVSGVDYTPVVGTLTWGDGDLFSKTIDVPIRNSNDPTQPDKTFVINLGAGAGEQAQAVVTIIMANSAVTYVHFDYDDSTTLSQERLFNRDTGFSLAFSLNGKGGVSLVFDNSDSVGLNFPDFWSIDFAPAARSAFVVGDYQDAIELNQSDATHPGLQVDVRSFASEFAIDTPLSTFQVLEIQFNADGTVAKFAADFDYTSANRAHHQRGEVRYNSTIPIKPDHGVIEFTQSGFEVPRDCGAATVIVNRVGGSAGAQRVSYSTSGLNSAVSGIDFVPVFGTLDWADGDTAPKTFQVPVLNSQNPDDNSPAVFLRLDGLRLGVFSEATLYLAPASHQSRGIPQFNKLKCAVNVADAYVTLQVDRVGGASGDLVESYQTVDGTAYAYRDYISTSDSLVWKDGDSSPKTLRVPLVTGQAKDGSSRSFSVLLSTEPPGSQDQETVTIVRTNAPAVSVKATTARALESGGAPAVFTLNRNGDTSAPLTIKYKLSGSAINGRHYRLLAQKKVIKAGRSSAQLLVRPVDLGVTGGKRTVNLALVGSIGYSILGDSDAEVTIDQDK